MKAFILSLFTLLLLFSCQSDPASQEENAGSSDKTETPAPESEAASDPAKQQTMELTYESAAVYAGKTEYAFLDGNGKQQLISVSNEENVSKIKMPDNMLEDDENLEGPPGANPEMVGKSFEFVFDQSGNMIEVRLKQ